MTVKYRNLLARAAGLLRAGDSGAADAICRHVLEVDPGNIMGLYVSGLVAHELGDHARSFSLMDRAILAQPDFADAFCGRGLARRHLGQREAALADFRRAVALNPDQAQAHLYLGVAALEDNALAVAATEFERALEVDPSMAMALANLGLVRHRQGRLEDAISCYRRALDLQPELIANQNNLATALQELGRASDALEILRRVDASVMNPTFGANVLTCMNLVPGTPHEFYEAAKHWSARFAAPLLTTDSRPRSTDPHRRLRVGYVAANGLRRHTLAMTYLPLFEAHDPAEVDVFVYSDLAESEEDDITRRAQAVVSTWRSTGDLDDAALADQIRADEIDILVEGIGFAAGSRMLAAAHRPAPIQIHFPPMSTTGMAAFDYVIGDENLMPPGSEAGFTEQIWRLPCGFLYRPVDALPPLSPLPCARRGFVTFGSFNRVAKIGREAIALWAAVLSLTPNSQLSIKSSAPLADETVAYYAAAFAEHGIAPERVSFGHQPAPLQGFDDIDIALDTVPFGGVLTTCASLAMGVPVITWAGARVLERYGATILTAAGFPEGAAPDLAGYVARAAELAAQPDRLAWLRSQLRGMLLGSLLCDGPSFARSIESAYRAMWQRWCGEAARGARPRGWREAHMSDAPILTAAAPLRPLREIVLLTGAREAPHLMTFLKRQNPALDVTHVETRDDLVCAWHPPRPGARLIAFCTSAIVPANVLETFDAGGYNFHPGPPTYPGRHPASFAIYEGARRFGVTAHEMRRRVDSGPIVGVEWFDMPMMPRLSQVEGLSFEAAIRLFMQLGPSLATLPVPLPRLNERWTGWKSRQSDFETMCAVPPDVSAEELDRRVRAFADGLQSTLHVTLHGHRFRIAD